MAETLADTYAAWAGEFSTTLKASTVNSYALTWIKHLAPEFGCAVTGEIGNKDIKEFATKKLAAGLAPKTVRDIVAFLKELLRYADDAAGRQPRAFSKIAWPRHERKKRERLTAAECRRLSEHIMANPSPHGLGVLLALYTGMRIGEVCALRWEDVDFRGRALRVDKTLYSMYVMPGGGKGRVMTALSTPKTKSSRRSIPLPDAIMPTLRAMRGKPECYVLTGGPHWYEPRTMRDWYCRLLDRLGIGPVTFHGLRHTFASALIDKGCDVKTVSQLLGHSNVTTTMNIYVHPSEENKRRTVNKLKF